jgi:L-lactate dehydrogenase complex protein LldF
VVHWAENAAEACRMVVDIAKQNGVTKVAKSKSMVSEEVGLNDALLEAAGIEPVETDLGEYILQINDAEPPSHIVAPAMHKTAEDVADLFHAKHGTPRKTDPAALTREAREILRAAVSLRRHGRLRRQLPGRRDRLDAMVTNEGNGRMCTTLPRLHVAITGIEKVVPTLEDVSTLLRLLPRSATGQAITNYVSLLTGPKRLEETDGPQQFHIVLVDNGRAKLLGRRDARDAALHPLRRLHEPLPGVPDRRRPRLRLGLSRPDGLGADAVYVGLENAIDLPNAATMCNQCGVVCPVKIPLPDLLRKLREKQRPCTVMPATPPLPAR